MCVFACSGVSVTKMLCLCCRTRHPSTSSSIYRFDSVTCVSVWCFVSSGFALLLVEYMAILLYNCIELNIYLFVDPIALAANSILL